MGAVNRLGVHYLELFSEYGGTRTGLRNKLPLERNPAAVSCKTVELSSFSILLIYVQWSNTKRQYKCSSSLARMDIVYDKNQSTGSKISIMAGRLPHPENFQAQLSTELYLYLQEGLR